MYTDKDKPPTALHIVAQGLVNALFDEAKHWRERAEATNLSMRAALAAALIDRGYDRKEVLSRLKEWDGEDAMWTDHLGPAVDRLANELGLEK